MDRAYGKGGARTALPATIDWPATPLSELVERGAKDARVQSYIDGSLLTS
jgi:hypothetical protein